MSRSIKFQAYDCKTNEMITWDEINEIDELGFVPFVDMLRTPERYKMRQFTGLHDRNGKEIYEDSIVLITGEQELDYGLTFQWNDKAIVRWSAEECGFYLDVINKRDVNLCQDGYFTVDTFPLRRWTEEEWWIEYEVICEHPHLLKGDSTDGRS